jgi:subtilisin family serine protease
VTNNSWGTGGNPGSPWIGSEADPRAYDDNAYSGAQINVFAAGNGGPSASSIGEEASAKNVITVGNVIDYNDSTDGLPGGLWTGAGGSSQGPCGDGRWKPSVCAPGRWIESVDGFTSNAYTYKYGTSMAAPHVTGTIADLIDANAMWAYLPERVAAQLMATAYRRNDVALSSPGDTHLDQYGAGRIDGTRAIWSTSQETGRAGPSRSARARRPTPTSPCRPTPRAWSR